MVWFKVDDNLAFHHKAMAAGNPAMGMWVRAGSFCAAQLTDGFVPDHMVGSLGSKSLAGKLVAVGLWHRAENGYQFHEWDHYQPSRDDIEAKRAEARERMAAAREKRQRSREQPANVRANLPKRSQEPTEDVRSTPTRPDPTRPSVPNGTENTRRKRREDDAPDFDQFWAAYPRREGKGQARKAFKAAAKKLDTDALVAATAEYAAWCEREKTERRFIPLPATWLNGERWTDEREPSTTEPKRVTADELEEPPDGLTAEEYRQWQAERRAG